MDLDPNGCCGNLTKQMDFRCNNEIPKLKEYYNSKG